MNYKSLSLIAIILSVYVGHSQEVLTKEMAVSLALENNYALEWLKIM